MRKLAKRREETHWLLSARIPPAILFNLFEICRVCIGEIIFMDEQRWCQLNADGNECPVHHDRQYKSAS